VTSERFLEVTSLSSGEQHFISNEPPLLYVAPHETQTNDSDVHGLFFRLRFMFSSFFFSGLLLYWGKNSDTEDHMCNIGILSMHVSSFTMSRRCYPSLGCNKLPYDPHSLH
jgi:hypothetical protein